MQRNQNIHGMKVHSIPIYMIALEWPMPRVEAILPQLEALRNMHLSITLSIVTFTVPLPKRF